MNECYYLGDEVVSYLIESYRSDLDLYRVKLVFKVGRCWTYLSTDEIITLIDCFD